MLSIAILMWIIQQCSAFLKADIINCHPQAPQTVKEGKIASEKVEEKPSTAEQLYRLYLHPWVPDKIRGKVAI